MAKGRFSIVGGLFAAVTIGNLIEKFYPNEYTVWFKNPLVTYWFYAMALVIFAYPAIRNKKYNWGNNSRSMFSSRRSSNLCIFNIIFLK